MALPLILFEFESSYRIFDLINKHKNEYSSGN